MKKIAFIAGPALGHVSRMYTIAQQLESNNDVQIVFIGPSLGNYLEELVSDGFETVTIPIHKAAGVIPYEVFAAGLDEVFQSHQFDLIVHDISPLRWLATTRFPDCPRINVTNVFLTGMAQAQSYQVSRFEVIKNGINRRRARKGLKAYTSAYDFYEADRVLLADPIPLVSRYGELPKHYRACGPCFWNKASELPSALSDVTDALVLSMGSTGRDTFDVGLLRYIISWAGCKSSVYVGNKTQEVRELDIVDHIHRWLSLDRLLDKARVVASQGGAGSTYQALSKGIPVIVFPTHQNHRLLGEILEQMGLGLCIDMSDPNEHIDAYNFESLLANARAFAVETANQDGAAEIATHISELL